MIVEGWNQARPYGQAGGIGGQEATAIMAERKTRLVDRLVWERDHHVDHAMFYWTQVQLSFNSNHMEGSTLTAAQTAQIFETGRFLTDKDEQITLDDAIETANHFDAFNWMLDHVDEPVDRTLVCGLQAILKHGTSQERQSWRNVGDYKTADNEIVQMLGVSAASTAPAKDVPALMDEVYDAYARLDDDPLRIAMCHWMFEKVHPFFDGNGRVGRLVMFKECLRLDTVPPLIRDEDHNRYVAALDRFPEEPGWLVDLILHARDGYKQVFMDRMAANELEYAYDDDWDRDAYRDELDRAAGFKRRIERLARTARSGHDPEGTSRRARHGTASDPTDPADPMNIATGTNDRGMGSAII
ncbi:Fic family protein [Bifidobacterium tsurumiense]|uniref:Fic family protein n=2 Tax=Bifidobacterium tsurumiense TaxID=356829 RepID=A0A087E8C3_9BIFI|nr:Fic family protein [Bifidobacterium tsurumiense]